MGARDNKVIVVGAGVAGILSALWAQSCGKQVTLLEQGAECGGLLRSFKTPLGYTFDYGTHIPGLTSHPVVDDLMFGKQIDVDWVEISLLKKGNFFNSKLNTLSQFIDITSLAPEVHQTALFEIISSLSTDKQAKNMLEALSYQFGETLTKSIFTPLLKRIYQSDFKQLDTKSHKFLAYSRVIVSTDDVSKELKKSPVYDYKIAFNDAKDSGAKVSHLYPKSGGTGAWIAKLVDRFRVLGGEVMTHTKINAVSPEQGRITLLDGGEVFFEQLVWTGPIAVLAKFLFPSAQLSIPRFVSTGLHHFVVDERPLCDSHYIYMNDPNKNAFRVTLYSNITGQEGDFRVTVEAVASQNQAPFDNEVMLRELKDAGILAETTKVVESSSMYLPYGFPEMTLDQNQQNKRLRDDIQKFSNITLGGRGSSEAFFMNDVLLSLADQLETTFGAPK